MSHFNVSLIVWVKSQDSVHKPQCLKRRERRAEANRTSAGLMLSSRQAIVVYPPPPPPPPPPTPPAPSSPACHVIPLAERRGKGSGKESDCRVTETSSPESLQNGLDNFPSVRMTTPPPPISTTTFTSTRARPSASLRLSLQSPGARSDQARPVSPN